MNAIDNTFEPAVSRGPHAKLALVLGAACMLATFAVFPYVIRLMPEKIAALPVPLWILEPAQALQAGVLCWLLAWLGLAAGARHGLDAPWLRARVYGLPRPALRTNWGLAILAGLVSGAAVIRIDAWLSPAHAPVVGAWGDVWRGFLASFYGGIAEEVQCRLALVSVLAWLLAARSRRQARPWMVVLAIVIAALLFGAGHLPAAFASGMPHTPIDIGRILILNGLVGVVCGLLFWHRGLEHAILAHFSADLVLHVAAPMVVAVLA